MSGLARRQDKGVNQLVSICRYLLTLGCDYACDVCDIQHLVNLHTVYS